MDTSKEYIKMADCPEIQGQRKPKVEKMTDGRWHKEWELEAGDFIGVYSTYNLFEIEIKGTTIYDPYFYSKKEDDDITISTVGFDEGDSYTAKKIVWLPRQDQIQMMIDKTESAFCIYQARDKWGGEIYRDREQVFTIEMDSPEQLWLAFYMHEKHQKKWDDKKWAK